MLHGAPERRAMTMFDLIYFNPENGSRMASSTTAEEETTSALGDLERAAEEAVDNPETEETSVPVRFCIDHRPIFMFVGTRIV